MAPEAAAVPLRSTAAEKAEDEDPLEDEAEGEPPATAEAAAAFLPLKNPFGAFNEQREHHGRSDGGYCWGIWPCVEAAPRRRLHCRPRAITQTSSAG